LDGEDGASVTWKLCFVDFCSRMKLKGTDIGLRRYCREYESLFTGLTADELSMLDYLVERNDIVHDYVNYDINLEDEFSKFLYSVSGLHDIAVRLEDYLNKHDLMQEEVR
jgi:hypothetical protein